MHKINPLEKEGIHSNNLACKARKRQADVNFSSIRSHVKIILLLQLSFHIWTSQIQESLNCRKRGDTAFRAKDFTTAIASYTQFIDGGTMLSPTVFARRGLCYLMNNKPQEALADAVNAQAQSPEWPTAFYLQAAALFSLGMNKDAQETLKDASSLSVKWNNEHL